MPDEDITQISLGRFKVGLYGLKSAIQEVQGLGDLSEGEIAQALLVRLKPKNYIPAASEDEYHQALLREFKKARGEKVEEEESGLNLKILGTGCPACDQLAQTVMQVLDELGLPAEVEYIRDPKEILALGVLGVPALLINNVVKAAGRLPTKQMLRNWLIELMPPGK
jgi:small redox-active disulfide protein 2